MDHAMSHLWEYSSYARDELIKEWKSGEYKKLSACPSYGAVKAYCTAYNALSDYYYLPKYRNHQTPKAIVEECGY